MDQGAARALRAKTESVGKTQGRRLEQMAQRNGGENKRTLGMGKKQNNT